MKNNLFTKEERSTFKYWFAHWCAFNMVALNVGHWKFKYLFHDIEKPWMRLFMKYETLQNWHRTHSNHHLEKCLTSGFRHADWEAMVIDWECSRYTKYSAPKTALETIPDELKRFNDVEAEYVKRRLLEVCGKFNLVR